MFIKYHGGLFFCAIVEVSVCQVEVWGFNSWEQPLHVKMLKIRTVYKFFK